MSEARPELQGPAAPPRSNGELVFAHPWEARVFGLTLRLCESRAITWTEFQQALIAEIARWERAHAPSTPYVYYQRWLAALERVLAARGLCEGATLDGRVHELDARPHGHDH